MHYQTATDKSAEALDGQYIFSVSELNHSARVFLEQHFGQVYVSGEISNLSQPSSGHMYFSLKDKTAQIRCAFFRHKQSAGIKLQNGMQVIVSAQLSLYPERGDYQLIIACVFDAGLGLLQQQFTALKEKLSAAGLFAPEHKQPIPPHPQAIGVITSETGAALQDVLTVLKRRCPSITVYLYPSQVQGAEAPAQLIAALKLANQQRYCDVLLLTRGGGSLEDLWAFNNEQLAYAIYHSDLPIVSAVGHEVDFTIADYVADSRAPTPSAAAEMLSPDRDELLKQLQYLSNGLFKRLSQQLQLQRQHLNHLEKRLQHPAQRLAQKAQHLDHLSLQLQRTMQVSLQIHRHRFDNLENRLLRHSPLPILRQQRQRLDNQFSLLKQTLTTRLKHHVQHLCHLGEKLQAFSPLATLQRGYALVKDQHQKIITESAQVKVGDQVIISLAQGEIDCTVNKIES